MVKIYAPASIGNVSVGFDVLGAAVSPVDGTLLGDCVSVTAADSFTFTLIPIHNSIHYKVPVQNLENSGHGIPFFLLLQIFIMFLK